MCENMYVCVNVYALYDACISTSYKNTPFSAFLCRMCMCAWTCTLYVTPAYAHNTQTHIHDVLVPKCVCVRAHVTILWHVHTYIKHTGTRMHYMTRACVGEQISERMLLTFSNLYVCTYTHISHTSSHCCCYLKSKLCMWNPKLCTDYVCKYKHTHHTQAVMAAAIWSSVRYLWPANHACCNSSSARGRTAESLQ
jgi:hypothetical protein